MASPAAKFVRLMIVVEHELVSLLIARVATSVCLFFCVLFIQCSADVAISVITRFAYKTKAKSTCCVSFREICFIEGQFALALTTAYDCLRLLRCRALQTLLSLIFEFVVANLAYGTLPIFATFAFAKFAPHLPLTAIRAVAALTYVSSRQLNQAVDCPVRNFLKTRVHGF